MKPLGKKETDWARGISRRTLEALENRTKVLYCRKESGRPSEVSADAAEIAQYVHRLRMGNNW
jgi:hypothetical protein